MLFRGTGRKPTGFKPLASMPGRLPAWFSVSMWLVLKLAAARGLAVVIMEPLLGGRLGRSAVVHQVSASRRSVPGLPPGTNGCERETPIPGWLALGAGYDGSFPVLLLTERGGVGGPPADWALQWLWD